MVVPPEIATPVATAGPAAMPACPNCDSPQVARFCAECGERQPSRHDYSVRGMLLDAFHDATSLDGRLPRSIIALVARPGLLTREWFEGRRGRYVKPFSLFVILNVAFFLIQPHTQLLSYRYGQYVGSSQRLRERAESRREALGLTPAEFQSRFDATLQNQKKTMLAFCIPVLALVLAVLYAGRGRYFAEHLVFSVHAYAFLLVFLGAFVPLFFRGALGLLGAAGVPERWLLTFQGDSGISILLAGVMGTYLYLALRRVYGDRILPALARAAVLFLVIGQLTNVYHDVLFYTTLYSL